MMRKRTVWNLAYKYNMLTLKTNKKKRTNTILCHRRISSHAHVPTWSRNLEIIYVWPTWIFISQAKNFCFRSRIINYQFLSKLTFSIHPHSAISRQLWMLMSLYTIKRFECWEPKIIKLQIRTKHHTNYVMFICIV